MRGDGNERIRKGEKDEEVYLPINCLCNSL